MRLSDLKIALRLHLGFGIVIALLVVLVTMSYSNFSRLSAASGLNLYTYKVLDEIDAAMQSLTDIETGERGFALTGKEASLEPYNNGKEAFRAHVEAARKLTADNPRQQERLQHLLDEQQRWLDAAIDSAIKLRKSGTDADMAAVVSFEQAGKGKEGMDNMRQLIADIKADENKLMSQRSETVAGLSSAMSGILIGGGIVAALLALAVSAWLARNITGPLDYAVQVARRVAGGDLTTRVETGAKDETGELLSALKDMNVALLDIVSRVRSGTDTIATAAGEINSGNQDLSGRTEQQASSLEETASSMEELTSTVKQNADNARQANQLAATASETAVRGGEVVAQVVNTMGSINESARRISDIITVIDGIAFQTNILALNAAVEAARAGEQGRGFAVVAGEVRNLAQRSASAAKEIKELIGDSVEKVEAGSRLVDQAGTTMEEVVSSVKRVTDIIGEIAAASDEQRVGIEQVNRAIAQMDQATQQNAALVEQAAAAAEAMQDQAHELANLVGTFQTGRDAPARAALAAGAGALPAARPATPARTAIAPRRAARRTAGAPSAAPAASAAVDAGHAASASASVSAPAAAAPRREPVVSDGDWETF